MLLGGHHRVQAHRDADEAGFELTVSVDFGLLVGDIGQFYCLYKLFTTGVAALFASEVATVSKRIGMQYNIAYHTIIYYNIHVCMRIYIYIYNTQHIYIYIYIYNDDNDNNENNDNNNNLSLSLHIYICIYTHTYIFNK